MPDEHDHEHDTTPLDQVDTGTADALSGRGHRDGDCGAAAYC